MTAVTNMETNDVVVVRRTAVEQQNEYSHMTPFEDRMTMLEAARSRQHCGHQLTLVPVTMIFRLSSSGHNAFQNFTQQPSGTVR